MARAHGIDVSHHHRVVDWAAVQAAGYDFFGAKATNGRSVDPTFAAHLAGARQLPFTAVLYYHFPTPRSDAALQAARFVERVGPLRPNEFLVLDVEEDPETGWCPDLRFIEGFFIALGTRRPLVYTSARIWKEKLGSPSWPAAIGTDLWVPRYDGNDAVEGPEPQLPADAAGFPIWPHWTFWQDSETYVAPGVDGPCDHSVFNGSAQALAIWAGMA